MKAKVLTHRETCEMPSGSSSYDLVRKSNGECSWDIWYSKTSFMEQKDLAAWSLPYLTSLKLAYGIVNEVNEELE